MSNTTNTILAEEVREYIELYTNTTAGNVLEFAWNAGDLETCYDIIKKLKAEEHEC